MGGAVLRGRDGAGIGARVGVLMLLIGPPLKGVFCVMRMVDVMVVGFFAW